MANQLDELFDLDNIYTCVYEYCDQCKTTHIIDQHVYEYCMACSMRAAPRMLRVFDKQFERRVLTCGAIACNLGITWVADHYECFPNDGPYPQISTIGNQLLKEDIENQRREREWLADDDE